MIQPDDLEDLRRAIAGLALPRNLFRFSNSTVMQVPRHEDLEAEIRRMLLTKDPDVVQEGLSNVLYWLYQREGSGQDSIYIFRGAVRRWTLVDTLRLFDWMTGPGLVMMEQLRLPVFRDLATLSALRMFLEPGRYVCLRPLHMTLRDLPGRCVLHEFRPEAAHWLAHVQNEACYERWSLACRALARCLGEEAGLRAVDAERGLGELISQGQAELALRLVVHGESLRGAR